MTTDDKIRDLQYNLNREARKMSALSSRKIYKYRYLTGEEVSRPDENRVLGQAKFTYSALRKAFGKNK